MTMKTDFAPAERLEPSALAVEINAAVVNPVIDGLLNTVSGLLAVLNTHRQILALNHSFLNLLGIDDPDQALGLRPGEALRCIYHTANPAGCGTSAYCATCGAAIAMVACLEDNAPSEKECAIRVNKNGREKDLFLRVRACPIKVGSQRLILLFLQDITHEQQWEALGRVFFHDLSNIIYALVGSSEMLLDQVSDTNRDLASRIHRLSLRMAREVQMQKHLNQMADADYQPTIQPLTVGRIFQELETIFANHPAARRKEIVAEQTTDDTSFKSDFFLVVRVLTNMVTNALEATDEGRTVKLWADADSGHVSFYVWNHQPVADSVVKRIYQRNISSKAASGRGLGTYSMKLFGERFLHGSVDFTTSENEGTTFCFRLPRSPASGLPTPYPSAARPRDC
ncbi:PAS domain-containing sensor histidine kinase [Desulfosarcina ovata]|uniref:histidine kinase n=2 Tax=Desulfosarcina ovata TaxID=83564 RepID=A0A5K8AEZ8_9BACT|nr:PAS domain-containing sensor histidine kinase [Desulfosarcina ovata]BBO84580.1 sensor histidine kinase [Desulfosarcina ovata subsp. sediminis]BBO91058.1 sensor histidine kinase [Desulfosarcina ovata subsp. ovata]